MGEKPTRPDTPPAPPLWPEPVLQPSPEFQQRLDGTRAKRADNIESAAASGPHQRAEDSAARQAALASERTAAKEADQSAETVARMNKLRSEGHAPQRHHDPSDEQLAARMGDPVINSQTGRPELKTTGHVRAENQIDPMTGTTVDGVHGGLHRCGDYATRFDSAADFVAADQRMRLEIGPSGVAAKTLPISDVLGPNGHERLTGYYHDPANPGELKPVDFTGGTIFASYSRGTDGELRLRTMYANPVPFNPSQSGGIEQ